MGIEKPKTAEYFYHLGSTPTQEIWLAGHRREIANTQAGDYAVDFSCGAHWCAIYVDAITTGGDIVITGASVAENTGIVTEADTETITVDTTEDQWYKTTKRWFTVTNIDVTSGDIDGIDYDIYAYYGECLLQDRETRIMGYHLRMLASGPNPDIRLYIQRIVDDGSKKFSLETLEDITIDADNAGDQFRDNLRTGGDERSHDPAGVLTIWPNGSHFVHKQFDFDSYFSSSENIVLSRTSVYQEGLIIYFEGEGGGTITGVEDMHLILQYSGQIK